MTEMQWWVLSNLATGASLSWSGHGWKIGWNHAENREREVVSQSTIQALLRHGYITQEKIPGIPTTCAITDEGWTAIRRPPW